MLACGNGMLCTSKIYNYFNQHMRGYIVYHNNDKHTSYHYIYHTLQSINNKLITTIVKKYL